jgi:hypothetical protein
MRGANEFQVKRSRLREVFALHERREPVRRAELFLLRQPALVAVVADAGVDGQLADRPRVGEEDAVLIEGGTQTSISRERPAVPTLQLAVGMPKITCVALPFVKAQLDVARSPPRR